MATEEYFDWQRNDPAAFHELPDAFQDILRQGKPAGKMEPLLAFALDLYKDRKFSPEQLDIIRRNIFRCLGMTPRDTEASRGK